MWTYICVLLSTVNNKYLVGRHIVVVQTRILLSCTDCEYVFGAGVIQTFLNALYDIHIYVKLNTMDYPNEILFPCDICEKNL